MPAFRSLALSDAEIIRDYILPACAFVERGGPVGGQRVEPSFSRSAMKSVDANIARGSEAMNKAILEKAAQHRAMHRAGLGWVDFEARWIEVGIPTSLHLYYQGQRAILVRSGGNNACMLTGFQIRVPGGQKEGFDSKKPTQTTYA